MITIVEKKDFLKNSWVAFQISGTVYEKNHKITHWEPEGTQSSSDRKIAIWKNTDKVEFKNLLDLNWSVSNQNL